MVGSLCFWVSIGSSQKIVSMISQVVLERIYIEFKCLTSFSSVASSLFEVYFKCISGIRVNNKKQQILEEEVSLLTLLVSSNTTFTVTFARV